ncbi:glycosyltransferase [uncultured Parvimonas sp.]|jgi:glycosyltransferase|uniref:glycosyltransferase n=1 Tax=uncultured Parvimonas sp. TaxID=747372 RepID=UPI00325FD381
MKILILNKCLMMGGIEKVLLETLKNLSELYDDIDLVLKDDYKEQNLFLDEIPKNVKIHFLFEAYSGKNRIKKEIKREIKRFFYPIKLKKFLKNKNYDVVIDFSYNLFNYKIKFDVPVIGWAHFGAISHEDNNIEKDIREGQKYKKYDKVIAICEEMRDEFVNELGIEANKVEMIYNAIDIEKIKKKSEEKNDELEKYLKEDYILQVSRMVPQKQPEELIEVYRELKKRGIKEKLYYVGNGKSYSEVQEKIKKYNLENDIILLGQQLNPYPFFKNAKLFLHTAKHEGIPTVLIESMALDTVVSAYSCPTGVKELLGENDEYGALSPLNDRRTIVEKTFELLNNEEKYDEYKSKIEERVKDFTMEKNKEKLKELIEKTVKNK